MLQYMSITYRNIVWLLLLVDLSAVAENRQRLGSSIHELNILMID